MKTSYLLTLFFLFVSCIWKSQGQCGGQWFGSRCQYLCHCEGPCDATGDCVGDSICAKGWFGPKCQYKDLTNVPDASVVVDPPQHSNWLDDNDDFSCSTNPHFHSVQVSWKDSYPYTWMRIVTFDSSILLTMKVSFKTSLSSSSPELECLNQHVIVTNQYSIDVYCEMNVTVQEVILKGVKSLCSLYISGGRNSALKQRAIQSSNYTEDPFEISQASNAVDGDTRAMFVNRSCTHTALGDLAPTWTLTLDVPIVAKLFVLYNRYEVNATLHNRLQNFVLEAYDKNNRTIFIYQDPSSVGQLVYRVPNVDSRSSTYTVKIKAKASTKDGLILTLCEVEIYAECPAGTWGLDCNKSCPDSCGLCRVEDGSCTTMCAGKSDPPFCSIECPTKRWGVNCLSNCSLHCIDQMCYPLSGECMKGCFGFQNPPFCTTNCAPGYLGDNCTQFCSSHCDQIACNGQTRECFKGCQAGFMLPDCILECKRGFYGKNCSHRCSANCLGGQCSPTTGVCLTCVSGFQGQFCDQECTPGFWGSNCSQSCSNHCDQVKCNGQTSECLQGCLEGFQLPNCTINCQEGRYGKNCALNCSTHCLDGKCNPFTGQCLKCQPGFVGVFCESECPAKFYGQDCTKMCNDSCVDQSCHPITGSCYKCFTGRGGPQCDDCPLGTYGDNCALNCSSVCKLGTGCDPIYGSCYEGN